MSDPLEIQREMMERDMETPEDAVVRLEARVEELETIIVDALDDPFANNTLAWVHNSSVVLGRVPNG